MNDNIIVFFFYISASYILSCPLQIAEAIRYKLDAMMIWSARSRYMKTLSQTFTSNCRIPPHRRTHSPRPAAMLAAPSWRRRHQLPAMPTPRRPSPRHSNCSALNWTRFPNLSARRLCSYSMDNRTQTLGRPRQIRSISRVVLK